MKIRLSLLTICLSLLFLVIGCGAEEEPTQSEAEISTNEQEKTETQAQGEDKGTIYLGKIPSSFSASFDNPIEMNEPKKQFIEKVKKNSSDATFDSVQDIVGAHIVFEETIKLADLQISVFKLSEGDETPELMIELNGTKIADMLSIDSNSEVDQLTFPVPVPHEYGTYELQITAKDQSAKKIFKFTR